MPCSAVIACGQGRMRTSRIRTYNTACPCCAGGGRATQRWRSTPAWSPAAAPSGVHVRALTDVLLEWSHSSIDSQ
jgi:hypothetical protein